MGGVVWGLAVKTDLADRLIAYETEDMTEREVIEFFADLVASGWAWSLQGHYGRTAHAFIECGLISPTGEVLWDGGDDY
jgi:hypothetical protein